MKKIAIIIGVMLLILTGCATDEVIVKYASPEEIISRFENKETFAFVIGNDNCPACEVYLDGALKKLEKAEGVLLEYVDMGQGVDSDLLLELVDLYLNDDFYATPTTYFVVNGIVNHNEIGAVEYKTLSTQYKRYIK